MMKKTLKDCYEEIHGLTAETSPSEKVKLALELLKAYVAQEELRLAQKNLTERAIM